MKHSWLMILFLLFIPVFRASAEEIPTSNSFELYLERVDKKFDKGAVNFVAGWTEIIQEPIEHYRAAEGKTRCLDGLGGLGIGLFNFAINTAGGLVNAFTALIPDIEVPLPQGGVQPSQITSAGTTSSPAAA